MTVYGKERGFLMTVGASAEIAKLCPGQKLENLSAVFSADAGDADSLETTAKLICALNRGYETNQRFTDPSHKAEPLTIDEVLSLQVEDFKKLQAEAVAAMLPKREIQTESVKKNMGEPGER